jgi:hypothetical protein
MTTVLQRKNVVRHYDIVRNGEKWTVRSTQYTNDHGPKQTDFDTGSKASAEYQMSRLIRGCQIAGWQVIKGRHGDPLPFESYLKLT